MLLEPSLGGGIGSSSAKDTLTTGFGAGLRAGIETNEMFSAIDVGYTMATLVAPVGAQATGSILSAGLTVGGNFKYIPLRAFATFNFLSNYSGEVTLGATTSDESMSSDFSIKLGIGYFASENFVINLVVDRILFRQASYNQAGLTVSFPIYLHQPETPWRTRYRQLKNASPPPEEKPAEQAPEPEAAPLAESPPAEPPPPAPELPPLPEQPAEQPVEQPAEGSTPPAADFQGEPGAPAPALEPTLDQPADMPPPPPPIEGEAPLT